jgi:hypothetical protein
MQAVSMQKCTRQTLPRRSTAGQRAAAPGASRRQTLRPCAVRPAQLLCDALMDFAVATTEPYRTLCRERADDVDESAWQELLEETPGKPDHAAVVGFAVGVAADRRRSMQQARPA